LYHGLPPLLLLLLLLAIRQTDQNPQHYVESTSSHSLATLCRCSGVSPLYHGLLLLLLLLLLQTVSTFPGCCCCCC
jgi:hypothetical protein